MENTQEEKLVKEALKQAAQSLVAKREGLFKAMGVLAQQDIYLSASQETLLRNKAKEFDLAIERITAFGV